MAGSSGETGNQDGVNPAALARMVEGEIIPRLLVSCRGREPTPAAAPCEAVVPESSDIDRMASSAIRDNTARLMGQVELLLDRGMSRETLLLDVLAPTARLLGDWWEQDICDFIDVTMALWRLQEVLHELSDKAVERHGAAGGRAALFAVVPGDDHSLGSMLVEEMFRIAGWQCDACREQGRGPLLAQLEARHVDLVALTVSNKEQLAALPDLIVAVRRASCNPDLVVMVGGWAFAEDPDLALIAGADGSAPDARAAVRLAEALVLERLQRPRRAAALG